MKNKFIARSDQIKVVANRYIIFFSREDLEDMGPEIIDPVEEREVKFISTWSKAAMNYNKAFRNYTQKSFLLVNQNIFFCIEGIKPPVGEKHREPNPLSFP